MPDGAEHSRKSVLLIAFMFPPIVDAGAFRPLAFAGYLPEFGYDPIVLTRSDTGNLPVDPEQLTTLSPSIRVERLPRGFADSWNEHFRYRLRWLRPVEALFGKPPGWIGEAVAWRVAKHDELRRWEVGWMKPAIDAGIELIRRDRPAAILATAPPFETLKAGLVLHEQTGIPLVADFRDPWTYGVLWNPSNARRARVETEWEERIVRAAAKVLVVTPSMQRAMVTKYPEEAHKIVVLMNGYEDLARTDATPPVDRFVASYVGSIMDRRFPAVLFEALRRLLARHTDVESTLLVQFVGPNQCEFSLTDRIHAEGLSDVVVYLGPVGHDRARQIMRSSHNLLHIETVANYAVSSKLFEYFAASKPIVGIVPPGSDDEWFLHESGVGRNVGINDADAIADALYAAWTEWHQGRFVETSVDPSWLGQYHRREQTRKLALVLDESVAKTNRSQRRD